MRTIPQLLTELHFASLAGGSVALLLTFSDRESALIFPDAENCVADLMDAVSSGGEPIGFVSLMPSEIGATFSAFPLPEYFHDYTVRRYLKQFSTEAWFSVEGTA